MGALLHYRYLLTALSCLIFASCRITVNTTGGTVNKNLTTISVALFENQASIVVPILAQELTNQIQDRFLAQSRLSLTSGAADVMISGAITDYGIRPISIQGDNRAGQTRLTISIKVKYENAVDPDDSWEQSFSNYIDFSSDADFTAIERDRIDDVLEQLTQEIFNKSLGKW